jgi:hypothetical protein
MQQSGYTPKLRQNIIRSGIEAYEKQVKRADEGVCPMYRPKGYAIEERIKKKAIKQVAWHKPYDSVLFCPPTPDSRLAKELRLVAERYRSTGGVNVKIIERAGKELISLLPGIQEDKKCEKTDCIVHINGGKGDCRKENVVYTGQCCICSRNGVSSMYIGETSRSTYFRGRQHLKSIQQPLQNSHNAFSKHLIEHHPNQPGEFTVNVVQSYKNPLERQVAEGVKILNMKPDIQMNSRLDHFQPAIGRITINNQLQ